MRVGVKNRRLAVLTFVFLVATSAQVFAGTEKDLGTVGTVYPIAEPDLTAEMRAYAQAHTPSLEQQRKAIEHYQPRDLRKLPKATRDRTFDVDMTYTLTHDMTDGKGKILYPKGYTFNPLKYVNFTGGLVIIDGSDPRQVEWFKKSPYFPNKLAILLLSDGYASQLNKTLNRPVYYLTGQIADRFRLAAVPSIVVRKGDVMSVREVKLNEK